MTRKKRIQYEGAWYHIMNRGAGRKYILADTSNKQTFLQLIGDIYKKYGIEIHAYCLMDNHYHLLVRTPELNLSKAMKHLQALYTRIYNKIINSDGPIFRGRYKAVLIESTTSVLHVCRYIHLNPVEANFTSGLNYKWSSFKNYVNINNLQHDWLHLDFLKSNIGEADFISKFQIFHNQKTDNKIQCFYDINNNTSFSIMSEQTLFDCAKTIANEKNILKLSTLEKHIQDYFISTQSVRTPLSGHSSHAKITLLIIASEIYGYPLREITNFFGYKQTSTASKTLNKYIKLFSSPELKDLKNFINDSVRLIVTIAEKLKK